uniref:Late nodulin n=1 Tax=Vicia faba TaxID=3906 RepID=Q9LE28_VICFA|nr:late nodulin [Vicia faba]CAB96472.1 late nodulin [Vicia faba]
MAKFLNIVHFMILLISVFFIERNMSTIILCKTDADCIKKDLSNDWKCIENQCKFVKVAPAFGGTE